VGKLLALRPSATNLKGIVSSEAVPDETLSRFG